MAHAIPDGLHAIVPHLVVKGASEAIEFYKRAFGAVEHCRIPDQSPAGANRLMHASVQIGDSRLYLVDEMPEHGCLGPNGSSPVTIHLNVTDVDATFERAVEAGATPIMPPADMFWGDRYGRLIDPFGHHWSMAEHVEDLSPEQMRANMAEACRKEPCEVG